MAESLKVAAGLRLAKEAPKMEQISNKNVTAGSKVLALDAISKLESKAKEGYYDYEITVPGNFAKECMKILAQKKYFYAIAKKGPQIRIAICWAVTKKDIFENWVINLVDQTQNKALKTTWIPQDSKTKALFSQLY